MNNRIVADADILVALTFDEDPLHNKAKSLSGTLAQMGTTVVFPNTAILEAITALKRSLNRPAEAHFLNQQYLQGAYEVEYVDSETQKRAGIIFEEKAVSKKNTIFDAVVAATAEKLATNIIFSFDEWYSKLGFNPVNTLSEN
ncbi:MAG: PIN domain-containing protein [Candidatus Blackburnbacteria bacterium]|nr:PIN domain-containing protein [Candidatus Blackburnbacteria bacterium]